MMKLTQVATAAAATAAMAVAAIGAGALPALAAANPAPKVADQAGPMAVRTMPGGRLVGTPADPIQIAGQYGADQYGAGQYGSGQWPWLQGALGPVSALTTTGR